MPILQINFKLNAPADAYAADCQNVVNAISNVAGLRWKIWILNEQTSEAGGIYCFDSEESLNGYVMGPIVARLKQHPAVTDVSVKRFDVLEDLTRVTRGPVAGNRKTAIS
jgi:Putative mono-oxygenase ydhR